MNTETGEIYTGQDMINAAIREHGPSKVVPMREPPTVEQMGRVPPRVKGHERCPCGSGKLFKNCCKT